MTTPSHSVGGPRNPTNRSFRKGLTHELAHAGGDLGSLSAHHFGGCDYPSFRTEDSPPFGPKTLSLGVAADLISAGMESCRIL